MSPFRKEYHYFLSLCETENISAASESIGINQSGLSKSLKLLENELKHPLFYRTNRGLKITAFGKLVQKNLLTSLKNWESSFDRDVKSMDSIEGDYSLGLHQSIGLDLLDKFYPKLVEENKNLNLKVFNKRSPEVVSDVLQHKLNFGIVAEPFRHPDLVILPLAKNFIGLFWSKNERPKEEILYYNPEMIQIVKTLKKYKDKNLIPIEDYDTIASIVSKSNGTAILPSSVAKRYSKLKLYGSELKTVSICLIYRYDIIKNEATKLILDEIKTNCT